MWPSCRRRGELVVIGALTVVPLLATAGLAAAARTVRGSVDLAELPNEVLVPGGGTRAGHRQRHTGSSLVDVTAGCRCS